MQRRTLLQQLCLCTHALAASRVPAQAAPLPDPAWYQAALAQKQRALGWGDQPYGAVLVLDGRIVGEGPSRVVLRGDADAHAEREALRDARQRLGRSTLPGSVLVSTSRPCPACERAAAAAMVARMFHGPGLVDAGAPQAA
jgi:tRNA(adenine34) deaminase